MTFSALSTPTGFSSFFVSWWYSPDTKLGIYFNDFGPTSSTNLLVSGDKVTFAGINAGGINDSNGMGCSLEENYHYENLITQHPVEKYTAISDHIIPIPTVITVTGIITSFKTIPIYGNGIINFTQLGMATQLLVELAQANTGITLTTGLLYGTSYARYDNLAVQTLDLPRTNQYGRSSLKFTITFKQLLLTTAANNVVQTTASVATPGTTDIQ